MKTKINYLLLAIVGIAACNNQNSNTVTTTVESKNKMNEAMACYAYQQDSNNVLLKIAIADNIVTGDLMISYYQKDKNSGKISGEMHGDTLFADYTFMSEGMNSTREVAFLKNGNEWAEGFGEVEEVAGKMIFKNRATLNYDNKMVLKATECLVEK